MLMNKGFLLTRKNKFTWGRIMVKEYLLAVTLVSLQRYSYSVMAGPLQLEPL